MATDHLVTPTQREQHIDHKVKIKASQIFFLKLLSKHIYPKGIYTKRLANEVHTKATKCLKINQAGKSYQPGASSWSPTVYGHALICQQAARATLPGVIFLPRYKYTHKELPYGTDKVICQPHDNAWVALNLSCTFRPISAACRGSWMDFSPRYLSLIRKKH